MRKVEELERQISELSTEEFAELRSWLVELRIPAIVNGDSTRS
jgi:ribosome maturation protein Sdo1